jgi:hypothetical protein
MEPMMGPLVTMTAFDLGQDRLPDFASYRFLYERLIGAAVRPWLPGAFCAAAALPHLHPERRRALLQSISEAAATAPGWSNREPAFFPEWVEKVDITVAGAADARSCADVDQMGYAVAGELASNEVDETVAVRTKEDRVLLAGRVGGMKEQMVA